MEKNENELRYMITCPYCGKRFNMRHEGYREVSTGKIICADCFKTRKRA